MEFANWYELLSGDREEMDARCSAQTEFSVEFGIWRDMVESPAKYGDDLVDWLDLNDKLTKGSGRWRLGAYWLQVADEESKQVCESEAMEAEKLKALRPVYSRAIKQAAIHAMRQWAWRDIRAMRFRVHTAMAIRIQKAFRMYLLRKAMRQYVKAWADFERRMAL
jgi:hypothetical protein